MPELPTHVKLEQKKAARDQQQKDKGKTDNKPRQMVIKGVDIPFWDLVILMVKIAFAAIPAGIIIAITWSAIFALIGNFAK